MKAEKERKKSVTKMTVKHSPSKQTSHKANAIGGDESNVVDIPFNPVEKWDSKIC